MILRADHIAGAFFVGFGLLVIALSGDLPIGDAVHMPGSASMPKIVAGLTIFFGLVLALRCKRKQSIRDALMERRQALRSGRRNHSRRRLRCSNRLDSSPPTCC